MESKAAIKMTSLVVAFTLLIVFVCEIHAGWSDKVLLSDVATLTLTNGKMTAGRRSSPVPQMRCVGGTARGQYEPSVVQCYNKGSDGYDVQWECKADMDKAYKFGNIQVTCEGYNHPDDPYILKGSCGLEYTLDLTGTGYNKKHHHSDSGYHHYQDHPSGYKHSKWGMGEIITLVVIGGVIFMLYRTCIKRGTQPSSHTSGEGTYPSAPPPPYEEHQPPPAYGFKPETTQGTHSSPGYGFRSEYTGSGSQTHNTGYTGSRTTTDGSSTGGSFVTGMATGGLLGYLFGRSGNSSNRNYGRHHSSSSGSYYGRPNQGSSWFGSSWGDSSNTYSSSGFSSGSRRSSSNGSGTHTSTGFGGTSRR